jgi:hypothetical protein
VSSSTQASPALSDVFTPIEYELNRSQSVIQTPEARAAALATAEQEINASKRLVLSMLTNRNMLAPISILPTEILAHIFHIIVFPVRHQWLGWYRITHVCRRWRQIALDDSTLWAHFSDLPRNKDWIAERLSRARNAPLVIELDGLMMIGKDSSLLIPHISRTRELYLRNLSSFRPEIVHKITMQEAPVLECLELSEWGTRREKYDLFFKGPLPKLKIFRISHILFPWSLFPRGQLRQLKVTLSHEVSTMTSTIPQHDNPSQLIGLLVDSPSLEVLTLDNCLPAMLSKSSGGQIIYLPRLSRLCLGGVRFSGHGVVGNA